MKIIGLCCMLFAILLLSSCKNTNTELDQNNNFPNTDERQENLITNTDDRLYFPYMIALNDELYEYYGISSIDDAGQFIHLGKACYTGSYSCKPEKDLETNMEEIQDQEVLSMDGQIYIIKDDKQYSFDKLPKNYDFHTPLYDCPPSLIYEGITYSFPEKISKPDTEMQYCGRIQSAIHGYSMPNKELETNIKNFFGCELYSYEDDILVNWNEQWYKMVLFRNE